MIITYDDDYDDDDDDDAYSKHEEYKKECSKYDTI